MVLHIVLLNWKSKQKDFWKINKTKSYSVRNSIKLIKLQPARLMKTKRIKENMNHSIRKERDNITTDTKAIRKEDQCILQITLCQRTHTTFKKLK